MVIKAKNGVCRVIKAKEKTPATIAGPFKTKEEAQKAKEKECPKDLVSQVNRPPHHLEKDKLVFYPIRNFTLALTV